MGTEIQDDKLCRKERRKEIAYNIFCMAALVIGVLLVTRFLSGLIGKRQAATDSGRDGEHSRQYGAVGEFVTAIDTRLIRIEDGLGSIAKSIGSDASGVRDLAGQIREIAKEVKILEDYVVDTRGDISAFLDWYYSALDNEIEQELGIRIPK